jgi:hypothetical protein
MSTKDQPEVHWTAQVPWAWIAFWLFMSCAVISESARIDVVYPCTAQEGGADE